MNVIDGTVQAQDAFGINNGNFAHPNCGGDFFVENNNIWFSVRGKKKIYAPDGKFVEEILY